MNNKKKGESWRRGYQTACKEFTDLLPEYWYEYGIEGGEIDLSKLTPKEMFEIVKSSAEQVCKNNNHI